MAKQPEITTAPKNELAALKLKQADALAKTTTESAAKLGDLVAYLGGLDADEIRSIISDKSMAGSLKTLGLELKGTTTATPTAASSAKKPAKKAGRGKRGKQAEEILAALGDKQLTTGEIKAEINYTGANLSAVLAGMKKAKKIKKTGDKWSIA